MSTSIIVIGLPRWLSCKESACQCRRCWFDCRVVKIPWRRKWQPTPVFSPRKSHGQRSLAGYSPWGHKESDITERLNSNKKKEFALKTFFSFILLLFSSLVWASLLAQLVKNPPAMRETWVRSQGWEDPLEKGTATHSGILAWTQLSNFRFISLLSLPRVLSSLSCSLIHPPPPPLTSRAVHPGAECLITPDCSIFSSLLGGAGNLFQEAFLS